MPDIQTDRQNTAPNGSTFEEFRTFVANLEDDGRGAHGVFNLIDPTGNDTDGINLDLLCLGRDFHGFYSTMTYDTEGGVMTTDFVLGEFWSNCVRAAWDEQDNLHASAEESRKSTPYI